MGLSKKLPLLVASIFLVLSLSCTGNNPPLVPSNPQPSDGATGQPGSLTLRWSGGDPDPELPYYDVYLGTTDPPPIREANLLERYCEIADLDSNTTHYWMIVAQDEHGDTAAGPVWSFSTTIGDSYEPNNWFDEAFGPLDFDVPYQSFISDRHDVDFFYFTPAVNGTATIELTNLPADYDLYLCDESENLLRFSENGKLEDERIIHYVTAWDKYYVIIKPCESCDSNDPYTLQINFDPSPTDTYEPNNWFNTAYGPLDFAETYESYIWNWDDEYDFYYFIPDTSGMVNIHLYSLPGDYDLALFDQNQEELASSWNSGTSDEVIRYYLNGAELYYAVIIPDDDPDSTDSYLLMVDYDTAQAQDSYEPNDSFDEAYGPLDFEMTYESWISTWDDVDFYYFVPASDGWIGIYLYSIPPYTDYDLYVYDSWYDLIDISDNEGNYDEWIEFYASVSETYYVVVEPFEGYDAVDSYYLELYYSGAAQSWRPTQKGKGKLKID